MRRGEDQLALAIGQAVETDDGACHEAFQDIVHRQGRLEEGRKISIRVQAEGVQGPHTGVWFGHHRVTSLSDEGPSLGQVVYHPAWGYHDPRLVEAFLHLRLAPDGVDLVTAYSHDIEVVPQARFGWQPVFVEGFTAVELSIFVREVS